MKIQSIFLLLAAAGLTPIALSYGFSPVDSLSFLFGVDASSVNVSHIFRAVMGLYLALAMFWVMGAMSTKYRLSALYSLVIFMWGLAMGRLLSLLVDGMPHWLLVVYLFLEFGFGLVGLKMIRKEEQTA
ncbi:DUF4345 domain-containing protein [Vibrio sp. HENC-03]|uniref:DUF4345 domain-containing protein n=1 Tax=Vibrio sp. HENC-03 TaxID=992012 RepID=UPI00028DDA7D|nr:DUF4345 domain-containing protein [Vibrio sp. HENC-03]EKM23623.1 putative membrane protein [Vibrio sp. HENC-03]